MKNLFTKLTIIVLASILVLTSVNAQNYWLNDSDYISPLNNRNVFLGDVPPYEGGGAPHVYDDEFNYRIKLLELGGNNGGLYSFTSFRPSLHAITSESSAVYAQTAGVGPAVLGVSKQNVNLLGIDAESSSLRNLEAGVAGVGHSTGVYGYGNLLGGWFNAEEGAGLYVTSASGLAAQFDGNVNVKVGYLNVGLGTDNGASIQTLTTDNTIGIYAESTQATAIKGESGSSYGIYGESYSGRGVYGTSTLSRGVEGVSVNNYGVVGLSQNNIGVYGESATTTAVKGFSEFGYGAYFETFDGEAALYAHDRYGNNKAAHFEGDVQLNGTLTGNVGVAGAVKIQTTEGWCA